ncbi:dTDP-4-dehydrorhamnose reductase [Enterovibrio norvegicus]|uniref:dTDP-4-dehydrorhamnose reductase n=1 Tax=Enterovibrio norvegicus TaxID=188144 RepID=UPI00352EED95
MRILITGSKGQIGACLVERLSIRKDITLFDRDREQLDITDSKDVMSVVKDLKPHIIINAAAHTAVDKAESEAEVAFSINATGPKSLARAAKCVNAAIIHISTDYVFNGNGLEPYSETTKPDPKSIYGITKLAGEKFVQEECPEHFIVRTSWVFSEHGNNFVKTMLRLGKDKESLSVVNDQYGGPTYAGDIADMLIRIADEYYQGEKSKFGVYHFSGMPQLSWFEFAETIFNKTLSEGMLAKTPSLKPISSSEFPTPAARPLNSRLNNDKIFSTFGIRASDWNKALNNIKGYV